MDGHEKVWKQSSDGHKACVKAQKDYVYPTIY